MNQSSEQLNEIKTLLKQSGFTLDKHQPHLLGERFLMQNLTTASGKKYILLGTDRKSQKVVIKVAVDNAGKQELVHEQRCRNLLTTIPFSYKQFFAPTEIAFWESGPYTISVQEYLSQASTFIERPLAEQFDFALEAFKTQESARATTSSHYRQIKQTFGIRTAESYCTQAKSFASLITAAQAGTAVIATVTTAVTTLTRNMRRIEQYCGFLTHTDFVPHNFRIHNNTLYLLDCASLEFGNKHESWARFLNFMTLYNRPLEQQLLTYLEKNRSTEESESLHLLRLYRLVEIIAYYVKALEKSTGNLLELNQTRVHFWQTVLEAELNHQRVASDIVQNYQKTRDRLRSDEEKLRQKNLH